MSKRNITIIIVATLFLGLLALGIYLKASISEGNNKKSIVSLLDKEGYLPSNISNTCIRTREEACLLEFDKYASSGINLQLGFIDKETDPVATSSLEALRNSASKGDWNNTEQQLQRLFSRKNELIQEYISFHKKDISAIRRILISSKYGEITNLYFYKDWAIITVLLPEADPANILLQKKGSGWEIMEGPGTSFEGDVLSILKAPNILYSHLRNASSNALIPFGDVEIENSYGIYNEINVLLSKNLSELDFFEELPYEKPGYRIEAEYINNLPNYLVTVYFSNNYEKSRKRDEALEFFTTRDYKPELLPIEYLYIEKTDGE